MPGPSFSKSRMFASSWISPMTVPIMPIAGAKSPRLENSRSAWRYVSRSRRPSTSASASISARVGALDDVAPQRPKHRIGLALEHRRGRRAPVPAHLAGEGDQAVGQLLAVPARVLRDRPPGPAQPRGQRAKPKRKIASPIGTPMSRIAEYRFQNPSNSAVM